MNWYLCGVGNLLYRDAIAQRKHPRNGAIADEIYRLTGG